MPNKFEEIKSAKHPLDLYPDIVRYAELGAEGWTAITDDAPGSAATRRPACT